MVNETEIPEKLVSASTSMIRNENKSPHPFLPMIIGQPPQQFTTQKPTTTNYPQLNLYRNRYYPKNIQDIIGYMTKSPKRKRQREKQSVGASNQENYTFSTPDPFSSYKPQDPGDINLLATASFRFAPPIWGTTTRNRHNKQYFHQAQQVENTNIQENLSKRPMIITLNIYPMDGGEMQLQRYGQQMFPYYFNNRNKFFGNLGNKMTIHLNLLPMPGDDNDLQMGRNFHNTM